jgi:hypothetical protein
VTTDQARERSALIRRLASKVAERAECNGITVSDIKKTEPDSSRRKSRKKEPGKRNSK